MPLVGSKAPLFTKAAIIDGQFSEVSLEKNIKAGKWTVLSFYPMAYTFVCPTEIVSFGAAGKTFKDLNAEVYYASTDSEFVQLAWDQAKTSDGGLGGVSKDVALVADTNHSLSRDYDVLVPDAGIALRGTFIIDPQGVIQHATINNAPVGRNAQEIIRLLEAFQFTAEHGEVCPAGWQKGDETIDTKNASKYFSHH